MSFVRFSRAVSPLVLLSVVCLSGCGKGVYDQRFEQRLTQLKGGAKWNDFYAPSRIPDSPITIRLPLLFKSCYLKNTSHVSDNGAIHPTRFQPPFLNLPGAKLTFESFVTENGVQSPYYCYLAVTAADPDLTKKLGEALKKTFPAAPTEWEEVSVESPQGNQLVWKKLRMSGQQNFDVDPGGGTINSLTTNGYFEIWVHEANGYSVMVGWRVRDTQDAILKLLDKAPVTAGTLAFVDPAAEPAPGDAPADAPAPAEGAAAVPEAK